MKFDATNGAVSGLKPPKPSAIQAADVALIGDGKRLVDVIGVGSA